MIISLRNVFFLVFLLLSSHAAFASPREDAVFIVERSGSGEALDALREHLRESFVDVYERPLSEQGIEIADRDRFKDLIPDEDVEPFVQRFLSEQVEVYLSNYSPEELAFVAAGLRLDNDATIEDVWSAAYQDKFSTALEQARGDAVLSGSEDPEFLAMEEFALALAALADSGVMQDMAADMGRDMKLGLAFVGALVSYRRDIKAFERELDSPVIVAATQDEGILAFANPIQRQTLRRQLGPTEASTGIRFIRPPIRN